MEDRVCIVGLDEPEYTQIRQRISSPVLAHLVLPRIVVNDGRRYERGDCGRSEEDTHSPGRRQGQP